MNALPGQDRQSFSGRVGLESCDDAVADEISVGLSRKVIGMGVMPQAESSPFLVETLYGS